MLTVGEQFVISLYQNNTKNIKSLDELRALIYKSPKYVSIQRMPPTTRSCYFHLLRVHLQINTWKNLETKLSLENHGFTFLDGDIVPVITDIAAAPDEILRDIRCLCQKKDPLCSNCSCAKKRIP